MYIMREGPVVRRRLFILKRTPIDGNDVSIVFPNWVADEFYPLELVHDFYDVRWP